MAIYSIGRATTNVTSGQAAHTLITAATDRGAILEAGLFNITAAASTYSLGRPAAAGSTPTSPVALQAEDPGNPAATITSALAWGTSPTSPTYDLRRINLPATIAVGVIFTFPRGIIIPISSNFVLQNLATNTGGVQSYFVVDE